jgi:hypothetical protein
MTMERDAQERGTPLGEKMFERFLVWIKSFGDALDSPSVRLRRVAAGVRRSTWIAFAIVVAGNIIAFNYFQERITRYYLGVLLMNIVSLNADLDSLQAKISQLDKKLEGMDAKLDKPAPVSSLAPSASPSSNSAKHRSR